MKKNSFVIVPFLQKSRVRRSGSALLIILGCVALLTILVTAFLFSARTEFTTSNFYAKGVNTKLLSENVINLVMAQLREGARSTDVNSPTTPVAWASQPGMIRTYGKDGKPYEYFKLYSDDDMVGLGAFDETANQIPTGSTGWASLPNIYTDLNEPVNGIYPILDPAAANPPDGSKGPVEGFSYSPQPLTSTNSNPLPMPVKWLYVLKDGTVTVGAATGAGTAVSISGAGATNPVIGRVAFWTDDETCKVNINTASEGTFWDQPIGNSTEELGANGGGASAPYGFSTSIPGTEEFQRVPGHPATTCLSTVFGYGTNPVLPDTSPANASLIWPLTPSTYSDIFAPYFSLTPRLQAGGSMGGAQPAYTPFTNPDYRLYDSVDELAFDPSRTAMSVGGPSSLYPASNGASPSGRQALGITPQIIEQRRFFITAHSRAPEETLFGTPRISLWPLQDGTQTPVARTAKDNLLAYCSTINNQPYYFQRATCFQYKADAASAVVPNPGIPSSQSATQDFSGVAGTVGSPTTTPQTGVARNENLYAYLQALTGADIPGFGGNFLAKYPGANGATDRDEILTEMFDLLRSGVNTFNLSPNIYPQYTYTPFAIPPPYSLPSGAGSTVPIEISTATTGGVATANTHGLGRNYSIAEVALVFMASKIDLAPATATAGTVDASNRMSIGPGLPWACPIDYPNSASPPQYCCWNTSTRTYSSYSTVPSGGFPGPGTTVTIGDPQTTAIQAFLLIRPHSLLQGNPAFGPNIRIRVSHLEDLAVTWPSGGGANLGFPIGSNAISIYNTLNDAASTMGGLTEACLGHVGANSTTPPWTNDGTKPTVNYNYPFEGISVPLPAPAYPSPYGGEEPAPSLTDPSRTAPPTPKQIHMLTTAPGGGTYAGTTMNLNGTTLQIDILDGVTDMSTTAPQVLQTVFVTIPPMTLPVPTAEMALNGTETLGLGGTGNYSTGPRIPGYGVSPASSTPTPVVSSYTNSQNNNTTILESPLDYYWQLPYDPTNIANRFNAGFCRVIYWGDVVRSFEVNPSSQVAGDMRLLSANPIQTGSNWPGDGANLFVPLGSSRMTSSAPNNYTTLPTQGPYTSPFIKQLHSLVHDVGEGRFAYTLVQTSLGILSTTPIGADGTYPPYLKMAAAYNGAGMYETSGALFPGEHYNLNSSPIVTPELNGAFMDQAQTIPGDWTLGIGDDGDGAFVEKPDEGEQNSGYYNPYYYTSIGNVDFSTSEVSYSPNRQVASGIIFGTLPSRAMQGMPWCTLLFCPNPASNDVNAIHPGFGIGNSGTPGPMDYPPYATPPDHLFLDLFWMPVVEPYAISEPFSTAGKVNMNYEIVPFGWMDDAPYIHRSTALHAVMKSTRILAIPTVANDGGYVGPTATTYSSGSWPSVKTVASHTITSPNNFSYRYDINLAATIDDGASAFQQRFLGPLKDIFRSASEICNVFLVPQKVPGSTYYNITPLPTLPTDASYASMQPWWSNFKLTGDNGRESPYNQIYPRLTTKSNTFEVHMRVQVLSQTSADRANGKFDTAAGDSIVGEYRGSAIVERYLDPNETTMPDFATTFPGDSTSTVDNYVHYRIVSTQAFSP